MKASSALAIAAAAFIAAGCTNPTGTAGTANAYYTGKITGIEVVDLDTNKYDTTTNTVVGAVGGAILGQLFNKHTSGTLVGAGLGAAAGNLGSKALNRSEGLRISIDSENGPMMVDVPFNCNYKVGQKVRVVTSSTGSQLQVYRNGAYRTAVNQKTSACPSTYSKFQAGVGESTE
jgi:outer membrane lipoprotein SlyB